MSDTSTYDNANFVTLGVTVRTYLWTWGTGAHADSFTLNIAATAVPEPSALAQVGGSASPGWRWQPSGGDSAGSGDTNRRQPSN